MDRGELLRAIATHFSKDELKTLCHELGVDYENLGAATKTGIARELVAFCERSNRIHDLLVRCQAKQPDVFPSPDAYVSTPLEPGITVPDPPEKPTGRGLYAQLGKLRCALILFAPILFFLAIGAAGVGYINFNQNRQSATAVAIAGFQTAQANAVPASRTAEASATRAATMATTAVAVGDDDNDGLGNATEAALGTNPSLADTDGDGLSDGAEVNQHNTDPRNRDTDGDTLSDGEEVNTYGTSPNEADTDSDGIPDGNDPFPLQAPTATPMSPTSGGLPMIDIGVSSATTCERHWTIDDVARDTDFAGDVWDLHSNGSGTLVIGSIDSSCEQCLSAAVDPMTLPPGTTTELAAEYRPYLDPNTENDHVHVITIYSNARNCPSMKVIATITYIETGTPTPIPTTPSPSLTPTALTLTSINGVVYALDQSAGVD